MKAPDRRALLAAVHIAKKELALADDSYRALLQRLTGQASSAKLGETQLRAVLGEFERLGWQGGPNNRRRAPKRAGSRPLAEGEQAAKARALWLSLYQLGEVRDPTEAALGAFARRVVGRDALQWLEPGEFNRLIEALKKWCLRVGFHSAREDEGGPQAELLRAQWRRLAALGEVSAPDDDALLWRLDGYCSRIIGRSTAIAIEPPGELQRCIEALGRKIRKALASQEAAAS